MFKRAWEYVVTVFGAYKSHVSGWLLAIVAIGLTIAAAFFVDDPSKSAMVIRWAARITGVAAIWLIFVAQYDAWRQEREAKQKALDELNKEADMQGTVFVFPVDSGDRTEGKLAFSCECANYGRKPCQISRIVFNVRRASGESFRKVFPLYEPAVKKVDHAERFHLDGQFFFSELKPEEMAATVFSVGLMDSLGQEYRKNIETIDKAPFSLKEAL